MYRTRQSRHPIYMLRVKKNVNGKLNPQEKWEIHQCGQVRSGDRWLDDGSLYR